jgi:DNA-binding HxlR family transcriptional regulator
VGAALSAQRVLAGKWTVPVVLALADGPLRYNRLLERLDGVSRRMLTATLGGLVADGLVEREPLRPGRVEYRLSTAGEAVAPVLHELSARLSAGGRPAGRAGAPAGGTRRPRPGR